MNTPIKLNHTTQEAELEALKNDYIHKAETHLALVKSLQVPQIETSAAVSDLSQCRHEALISYLSLHHFINRSRNKQPVV